MTPDIQDFGQKLAGARKDTYAGKLLSRKIPESGFSASDLFPTLNFAKLSKEGMSEKKIARLQSIRWDVETRPRQSWKVAQWEERIKATFIRFKAVLEMSNEEIEARPTGNSQVELMVALGLDDMKKAQGWQMASRNFTSFDGVKYPEGKRFWIATYSKGRQYRTAYETGSESDTECFKKLLALLKGQDTSTKSKRRKSPYRVYRNRETNTIFIARKIRRNVLSVHEGFETVEAARTYLKEHEAELGKKWEEMKAPPVLRNSNNEPRTGPNHRLDENMTPEQFHKTFPFRGVQFGNYVEDLKRQADLNDAYDGLCDLAQVLKIPTSHIPLNRSLGLAFGARGKGGRNAAAAHFEPDTNVINLTKSSGAGSLAHEWWHALDFSKGQQTFKGFATTWQNGSAFNQLATAIKNVTPDFDKRSKFADRTRTKPYFGTIIEMTARAFEAWVKWELAKLKICNDYLVNTHGDCPLYPNAEEMDLLAPYFQAVIESL